MVENAFQIIEEAVLVRRIDAFVILRTRLPDALVPTVLAHPIFASCCGRPSSPAM